MWRLARAWFLDKLHLGISSAQCSLSLALLLVHVLLLDLIIAYMLLVGLGGSRQSVNTTEI